MQAWAVVNNAAGTLVTPGPVRHLRSVRATRVLDGAGELGIIASGSDGRAVSLLPNERRPTVYIQQNKQTRLFGAGVIRTVGATGTPQNWQLNVTGPDTIKLLDDTNVRQARKYVAEPVGTIVANLLALAGWTATIAPEVTQILSVRFDMISVLKALQQLASNQGFHFRLSDTVANRLEFGAFGEAIDLTILQKSRVHTELLQNEKVALIEKLEFVQSSEAVANRIFIFGAGQGDAALTLQHCTRSSPYSIHVESGPDGRPLYYLQDDASIAIYGVIERVFLQKNIAPLSNSQADLTAAANALYDAAAAWLQRNSVRMDAYRVTLRGVKRIIRAGDRIRIVYKDFAYDGNTIVNFVDIDDDFWVIRATERIGVEGAAVDLELASIDRQIMDEAKVLVGMLDSVMMTSITVQPYRTTMADRRYEMIDNTHPVKFDVLFTDATLQLNRALLRIKTYPFRTNAQSAASGGGSTETSEAGGGSVESSSSEGAHRHEMFSDDGFSTGVAPTNYQSFAAASSSLGGVSVLIIADYGSHPSTYYTKEAAGAHTHTTAIPDHTHAITFPDHEHQIEYGINDDTQRPARLHIKINGTDRTAILGGPWAAGGTALDVTIEISDYLVINQSNSIEITCEDGQGTVETYLERYETQQPINLS